MTNTEWLQYTGAILLSIFLLSSLAFFITNVRLISNNSDCIKLGFDRIIGDTAELHDSHCKCLEKSYRLSNNIIRRAIFMISPIESDIPDLKSIYESSCGSQ